MHVLIVTAFALLGGLVDCGERDGSASNSSFYSTREMRDMVLKDWAGKTEEIQQYFDQLPSKEFHENSEDLKLKLYYERKGMENLDSNEVFNITPKVRHPPGPEYTIEVNDSYVPKHRMTTSEERRVDLYGTFNSESSESSTASDISEGKPTTELPDSGGKKPTGKTGKRGQKKWPPHMNPKLRRKKRKKPKASATGTQLRDNQITLVQMNMKKIQDRNDMLFNKNRRNYMVNTRPRTFQIQMPTANDWLQHVNKKVKRVKNTKGKSKTTSIFNEFIKKQDAKSYPQNKLRNLRGKHKVHPQPIK